MRRRAPFPSRPTLRRGEYRASKRELFRVEELHGSRAFVENCRTGELVDVGLEELETLRPVRTGCAE